VIIGLPELRTVAVPVARSSNDLAKPRVNVLATDKLP